MSGVLFLIWIPTESCEEKQRDLGGELPVDVGEVVEPEETPQNETPDSLNRVSLLVVLLGFCG
jgi:hypothetical protein